MQLFLDSASDDHEGWIHIFPSHFSVEMVSNSHIHVAQRTFIGLVEICEARHIMVSISYKHFPKIAISTPNCGEFYLTGYFSHWKLGQQQMEQINMRMHQMDTRTGSWVRKNFAVTERIATNSIKRWNDTIPAQHNIPFEWMWTFSISIFRQELRLYSNVAIAIELVRNTIQHFKYLKSTPFRSIWKIVSSTNLKFIIFAVGYPSAYRVIELKPQNSECDGCSMHSFHSQLLTCLFNAYSGGETRIGNISSAFLSAIFFYAYPNVPIFAHALACTAEILWQRFQQSSEAPKYPILQQIDKLPLAKWFYVLACGYLFHVRTFYPWQTPSILMKVMCLVTKDQ